MEKTVRYSTAFVILCLFHGTLMFGQSQPAADSEQTSRLRGPIERFAQDVGAFNRLYTAQTSQNRSERFRQLYAENLGLLERMNFASLSHDEQIDYLLFANHLRREMRELDREKVQFEEMAAMLPFARAISDLEDQRRRLESFDPAKTAALLDAFARQITDTQKGIEAGRISKPKR